jgi:hypothetical protein
MAALRSRSCADALCGRELHTVIHALHLGFGRLDRDGVAALSDGKSDGVGEVILTLGVVVADGLEQSQGLVASHGHHSGVREGDGALGRTRILVLPDRLQSTALGHEPAVAGRVGRLEPEDGDRGPVGQRSPKSVECLRRDQRRVGEGDDDVIDGSLEGEPGGKHGVSRPEPLGLHEQGGGGYRASDRARHVLATGTDDDGNLVRACCGDGCEHMRQHGPTRDAVQHFRFRGFHPRALASRQDDC